MDLRESKLHLGETFSQLSSPNHGNPSSKHSTDSNWDEVLSRARTRTLQSNSAPKKMEQTVPVSKLWQCPYKAEVPLPKMIQPNKKAEGNYSALFDSRLTCWIML